jgi:ketosteroid isomerase-like protein
MTVAPMAEPVAIEREAEIREKVAEYVAAYEARDIDRIMAMFAEGAEVTVAPGTIRGKADIRKLYEWDAQLSPAPKVRESGIGVLVSGTVAVCEQRIAMTAEGVPYEEALARFFVFDDAGLITRLAAYYDKLAVMHQIATGYPGIRGRVFRMLTGYLVTLGRKGLDVKLS